MLPFFALTTEALTIRFRAGTRGQSPALQLVSDLVGQYAVPPAVQQALEASPAYQQAEGEMRTVLLLRALLERATR